MKKHTYLNQSQKYLLAAMTIPLAVSILPAEQMVYASNEIPTLNIYELDGSPKLEWATEILSENVLTKTGFENGDELPSLIVRNYDGLQSLTNEQAYNSSTSLKIGKTTPNLGNFIYDLATESDQSEAKFDDYRYVPNGSYISLTLKVKTDTKAVIAPIGNGGRADKQITFKEYFESDVDFKFAQKVASGQNYFYVTNPKEFKKFIEDKDYLNTDYNQIQFAENAHYVVRKKATNGDYGYALITNVDEVTGKVELDNPFQESFDVNEDVLMHRHINPVIFNNRTVENTNNEWETLSFNTLVDGDKYNYNTLLRGLGLRLRTLSEGNTYIDDVTFGYATEVEVYRDGQSVYKGYLSDFHDTTIKDTVKPNNVEKINAAVSKDFNVHFDISKPKDKGTKANYQIQAIAQNGNRGELSAPQEIEMKSDVVKYKYSISNQQTGIPTNEINTTNDLSIALKSINLETDYIHVQAIDANGNVGDVESFKVKDILDTSNLQELYDKLKDIEDNNSYDDFIDFINELEQLYGDNLPQDLKDRLQQLGEYHGINTSFLLLEEGDFRLSTSDIKSFGEVKLTAKKQTIHADFTDEFGVVDARGTQEGWNVSVSATPFIVETFDGFVGTPHQLPMGSLALNTVSSVEQIGTVHNSQLPDITLNQLTAIDGVNQSVQLLQADKEKGMGEFKFTFVPDALALTVDAVTAKIDTVNYPDKNTPYSSTVTWDLVSGPQI